MEEDDTANVCVCVWRVNWKYQLNGRPEVSSASSSYFVTLNYDQCSLWPPRARKKQKATLRVCSNSSDSHAGESTINAGWFDQTWQGFIQLFSIVLQTSVNKGAVMFTDFLLSVCQCCSCWLSVTSAVVTLVLRSVKKYLCLFSHPHPIHPNRCWWMFCKWP